MAGHHSPYQFSFGTVISSAPCNAVPVSGVHLPDEEMYLLAAGVLPIQAVQNLTDNEYSFGILCRQTRENNFMRGILR